MTGVLYGDSEQVQNRVNELLDYDAENSPITMVTGQGGVFTLMLGSYGDPEHIKQELRKWQDQEPIQDMEVDGGNLRIYTE